MKGLLTKDMELIKGNIKNFLLVYMIAFIGGSSTGPSFLISYVSILAAVMSMNTITNDEMNHGMAFILTFPVNRKEYIKEKYIFGTCFIAGSWLIAVLVALAINFSGFRTVSLEELYFSAIAGIFVALLAEAVFFPVQLKYGCETGRIALFVMVFGITALAYLGEKICEMLHIDFVPVIELGKKILALGKPVCSGMLGVLILLILLISCTIAVKIMEKKEY